MTQEQSPGALRAAEQIKDYFLRYPHTTIKEIAIVIDRETGASDLLAALEGLAVDAAVINNRQPIGKAPDSRTAEHWSSFRESINNAYTAISKAKEGSK